MTPIPLQQLTGPVKIIQNCSGFLFLLLCCILAVTQL